MKINFKEKREKAKIGDLIQFPDDVIGLVLEGEEVVLLQYPSGDDWFMMAKGHLEEFKKEEYIILAKANEWEINIKR